MFSDNPDDTLFLQLTDKEVGLVIAGLLLAQGHARTRGLPTGPIAELGHKIHTAIGAQKMDSRTS
jgi:hypothetical protein